MMTMILDVMAQSDAVYIHKHNGSCISILRDSIVNMSFSKYDVNNIYHEEWQMQEIETPEKLWRIPLSEIDSICMTSPSPESSIVSSYVPVEWDNTVLLESDVENCRFVLGLNESTASIKQGSVMTVNVDKATYIVLVTETQKNGDTIIVKGRFGDLSYIFSATEFTTTTDASSNYSDVYLEESLQRKTRQVRDTIDSDWKGFTAPLWNTSQSYTYTLYKSNSTDIYVDYKTGLYLDLDVKFRFGSPVEDLIEGIRFVRAAYYDLDVNLKGKANAGADYTVHIQGGGDIDLAPNHEDKYELVKPMLFPSQIVKFNIGYVPVWFEIGADLFKQVSLKAEGELNFNVGFETQALGMMGVRYNGTTSQDYVKNVDWSFSCIPHNPTLSGDAEVEGKLYLFPRIHTWLYGIAGPSFDIKPYLRANMSIGFSKDLIIDSVNDYFAWSLTAAAGVDWALGLSSRGYGNFEGINKQLFDGTFTRNDWKLYSTPKSIEFVNASAYEVRQGEPVEVRFLVTDDTFLEDVPTPFPQIVKFECKNGKVNGSNGAFSIVKDGYATATWYPRGKDDVLYAKIYNKKGEVIAETVCDKVKINADCPVSIIEFKVTNSTYQKETFSNDGLIYDYRFEAATTVTIDDDVNKDYIEDWGYVYEDPYGKTKFISLKKYSSPYTDTRYAYYRNDPLSSVKLYSFVKYKNDNEYLYGDVQNNPLVYSGFDCAIENLWINSVKYKGNKEHKGYVHYELTANTSTNSFEDAEEWGIYSYTPSISESNYYPSNIDNNNDQSKLVFFELDFFKEDFDELDNDQYVAMKNVQIGVYKKLKDTGDIIKPVYVYSTPNSFELLYKEKPSLTFTNNEFQCDAFTNGYQYYFQFVGTAYFNISGGLWIQDFSMNPTLGNGQNGDTTHFNPNEYGDGNYSYNYACGYYSNTLNTFNSIEGLLMLTNGSTIKGTNYLSFGIDNGNYFNQRNYYEINKSSKPLPYKASIMRKGIKLQNKNTSQGNIQYLSK